MYPYVIVHNTYHMNTWYFAGGIDYYNNRGTSILQYIRDVVHRAFYLLHFRHYYCGNNSYSFGFSERMVLLYRPLGIWLF